MPRDRQQEQWREIARKQADALDRIATVLEKWAEPPKLSVPDPVPAPALPKQEGARAAENPEPADPRRKQDLGNCPSCGSGDPAICYSARDTRKRPDGHKHPMWMRDATVDEGGLSTNDSRFCCRDPFHDPVSDGSEPERCPTCRSTARSNRLDENPDSFHPRLCTNPWHLPTEEGSDG